MTFRIWIWDIIWFTEYWRLEYYVLWMNWRCCLDSSGEKYVTPYLVEYFLGILSRHSIINTRINGPLKLASCQLFMLFTVQHAMMTIANCDKSGLRPGMRTFCGLYDHLRHHKQ